MEEITNVDFENMSVSTVMKSLSNWALNDGVVQL